MPLPGMPTRFLVDTPRLRIRPWQADDREAFAAMAQDAAMMRFITGGMPMSEEQVDASLARQSRHMESAGFCMGAAEWKETGVVIGVIGLQPVDCDPAIDIGWWVRGDYQGRGIASEGAAGCLEFLRKHHPEKAVCACIHPKNLGSQAVARKLGLTPDEATVPANSIASWRPDEPVLVFRA